MLNKLFGTGAKSQEADKKAKSNNNPIAQAPVAPAPTISDSNRTAVESIHKQFNDEPTQLAKKYVFKKLIATEAQDKPELKQLLTNYGIDGKNQYNNAVLSDDGKTLVVVTDGITALKMGCGGTDSLRRFLNKTFGWLTGASSKRAFAKKYSELFNAVNSKDPNNMVHESLTHLIKGLKENHYHAVHVFHQDEKGKFKKTPDAVAITDSYYYVMQAHEKAETKDRAKDLAVMKEDYKKAYAIDKIVPLTSSAKDLKDVFHQAVEGLYAAQSFDLLTVPGQVHSRPNVTTNDLHYEEVPFNQVAQKQDGEWKIYGDKSLVKDNYFPNAQEKAEYDKHLVNEKRFLTIITAKDPDDKVKALRKNNALGHFANWISMYAGGTIRANKDADRKLIDRANMVNANIMYEADLKQEVAHEIAQNLEAKKPDSMMSRIKTMLGGGGSKTTPDSKSLAA
jgi:hypothetical protein